MLGTQLPEITDYGVGFGALAGMFADSVEEIRTAAIMEQEDALTETPERRGAELVGTGAALRDAIGKICAHVMNEQVGEEVSVDLTQARSDFRCPYRKSWSVAHGATACAKDVAAIGDRLRAAGVGGGGAWRSQEPHEHGKLHDIAGDARVWGRARIRAVLGGRVKTATWGKTTALGFIGAGAFVLEQLVRDAHFYVVSFAGEYFE